MSSFKALSALALSSVLVACKSPDSIASTPPIPIPNSFAFTPTNPAIISIAKGVPLNFSAEKPLKITSRQTEYKDGQLWITYTTDDGNTQTKTLDEFERFEEEISTFSVPIRPKGLATEDILKKPDVQEACKKLRTGLKFIRSGNKLFIHSGPWKKTIVFTKVQHHRNAVKCFETNKITFHDILSGRKLTIPKI